MGKSFDLRSKLRPNIANLAPYSSARDEYTGAEGVFLDANENPYDSVGVKGYNRYPDPFQAQVKAKISKVKNVPVGNIFLGNGSDEPIDLLFRAFCIPGKDNVVILPPTYGMYQVCADVNDVEIRKVNLSADFDIRVKETLAAIDEHTKLIWICSPNNPTGDNVSRESIYKLLNTFDGIVVVDEAYVDFSNEASFTKELTEHPNLVVLQTFSKAWGLAALRLGMAFASNELIQVLNKIKYPYNINKATQDLALKALDNEQEKNDYVNQILSERDRVYKVINDLDAVQFIYPSSANFLLVKITNARQIFEKLIAKLIIVRDRSKVVLCEDCLRVTIGTKEENNKFLEELKSVLKK